jgi:tRNA(Ile)-lysidine synthase
MASSRKFVALDLLDLPQITPASRIGVAYSGGLDSTVLLHALAQLRAERGFALSALHVHHGLSPNADAWARHCQGVCTAIAVPLRVARVTVVAADKGLEAATRAVRLDAFADFFRDEQLDWLMLAQHRDDQAETILFRLLRGAGSRGLAGMRQQSTQNDLRLWRPLLNTARAELRDWAQACGQNWIEDESNADPRHTRNWLRNDILPRLRERFPALDRVLARSATQLAEDTDLLDALAEIDAQGVIDAKGRIQTAPLAKLPAPRARNLLRHWLAGQGLHLDRARLDDLLRQALAEPDAHPCMQIGHRRLGRNGGVLGWLD